MLVAAELELHAAITTATTTAIATALTRRRCRLVLVRVIASSLPSGLGAYLVTLSDTDQPVWAQNAQKCCFMALFTDEGVLKDT